VRKLLTVKTQSLQAHARSPMLKLLCMTVLVGCNASVPSGVFYCDVVTRCPEEMVCHSGLQRCMRIGNGESAAGVGDQSSRESSEPQLAVDASAGNAGTSSQPRSAPTAGAGGRSNEAASNAADGGRSGVAGKPAASAGGAGTGPAVMPSAGTGGTAPTQPCTVNCPVVNDHCRGSGGQAVCDGSGSLLVCNADSSLGSEQKCLSESHCQAGLTSRKCAICLPNQDHDCNGASLEICAPDGQSFVKLTDCETVALCNKMLGACTPAICEANKPGCEGDTLTLCNADGSAFASKKPCSAGMCDQAGGDCNQCVPGSKKCSGNSVQTCNAAGQAYDSSACPNNGKCAGTGQCVACTADSDCAAMTSGCNVGYCGSDQRCAAKAAPDAVTTCSTGLGGSGVCSRGSCVGCIDDSTCAARSPRTPICDALFKSCGECSGSRGCTAGKVCSLDNRCIDSTPPPSSTTVKACSAGSCSSISCNTWDWCSAPCNFDMDCPAPTGADSVYCEVPSPGPTGYCYYSCISGTCPSGMTCRNSVCFLAN
jgi:hypothetical protein